MPGTLIVPAAAAAVLAVASVAWIGRCTERRGLRPPGFHQRAWRRGLADGCLALVLWLGVFLPALTFERSADLAVGELDALDLLGFHAVLVAYLVVWYTAGFVGVRGVPCRWAAVGWIRQLGFLARRPGRELALGVAVGLGGWVLVFAAALALEALVGLTGGGARVPQEPAPLVVALASLPVGWRLALSATAGVVEETFFRGLLQPRVGIGFSSVLFVLGHLAYGEPALLVGLTVLSLLYAVVARWRRSVWAVIVGHAVFDAFQLLVVIPQVLRAAGTGS